MQVRTYISVKATPLVSIITLNWNQTSATCQLLESTDKLTYSNYEVLVYDMGSAVDPRFAILSGGYKNVRLLQPDHTGRMNGINRAISEAKGDFILLLNNNSVVSENLIQELLNPLLTNGALGATCPKVVASSNPKQIYFAGYGKMNLFTGKRNIIGYKKTDNGEYDEPCLMRGIYTGAVMIRKKIVENSYVFSENFFTHFNDADITARITKKGYKIRYQPSTQVYANDVVRYTKKSPVHTYYTTRNRLLSMRRNTTLFQFSVFMTAFLLLGIPVTTIKLILFAQFRHLAAFYRGIAWNFKKNSHSFRRYSYARQGI